MPLSLKEVKKVAHLARLKLTEEEEKRFLHDLNEIFKWIDQLEQVDTGGVEPLRNAHDESCPIFEDEQKSYDMHKEILANSPVEPIQNFFRVPKVIE